MPTPLPESRDTKDGKMLELERVPLFFPYANSPFPGYDRMRPFIHLVDSFEYGRENSERVHHAQDLMAPRGTVIVSPVLGRVEKVGWNPYGGWTVSVATRLARSRKIVIAYFAHMAVPAAVLPGAIVQVGDVLGVVGNTGGLATSKPWARNAGPTHLHFALYTESAAGKKDAYDHPENMYSQLIKLTKQFYPDSAKGKIPIHPGMSNVTPRLSPVQFRTWEEDPAYRERITPLALIEWGRALALLVANKQRA